MKQKNKIIFAGIVTTILIIGILLLAANTGTPAGGLFNTDGERVICSGTVEIEVTDLVYGDVEFKDEICYEEDCNNFGFSIIPWIVGGISETEGTIALVANGELHKADDFSTHFAWDYDFTIKSRCEEQIYSYSLMLYENGGPVDIYPPADI